MFRSCQIKRIPPRFNDNHDFCLNKNRVVFFIFLSIACVLFSWLNLFYYTEKFRVYYIQSETHKRTHPPHENSVFVSKTPSETFIKNTTVARNHSANKKLKFRIDNLGREMKKNDVRKEKTEQGVMGFRPIFNWLPNVSNLTLNLHLPLSVLERYQKEHSADKLQSEYEACLKGDCNELNLRKFSVGYYACPYQAGNRLHHFMNSLLWSIVTNRTMLYKYYRRSDCNRVRRGEPAICVFLAEQETCNSVLRVAPWIPSLDEWIENLNLGVADEISFYSTHLTPFLNTNKLFKKYPHDDGFKIHEGIDASKNRFIHFGDIYDKSIGETIRVNRRNIPLLNTTFSRDTARKLLVAGDDFTYGMVLNASFHFNASLIPDHMDDQNLTTIAIHSRHSQENDDGHNINTETECLQKVISSRRNCRVYIMTDRFNALKNLLLTATTQFNCSVDYVMPTSTERSWRKEHGPFAGKKFYQDLLNLSTNPKDVLIYKKPRTSSYLIQELLVYNYRTHFSQFRKGMQICRKNAEKKKDNIVKLSAV